MSTKHCPFLASSCCVDVLILILDFYQLYDSTGPVNSYKRVSASNNSIGRIDLAGIAPPKNVTEVVKAISDQEGCKDTFISCDWSVYQNSTSSAALSEAALVPQGAGLEPTNPLILRFDADVGLERGRSCTTRRICFSQHHGR